MCGMDVIPQEWIDKVTAFLDKRSAASCIVTNTALEEWSLLFPDVFLSDLYDVLSAVLKNRSYTDSRLVKKMDEPGEVYEFMFPRAGKRLYSKINLCKGQLQIIVYSAHNQRLGNIRDGRFV